MDDKAYQPLANDILTRITSKSITNPRAHAHQERLALFIITQIVRLAWALDLASVARTAINMDSAGPSRSDAFDTYYNEVIGGEGRFACIRHPIRNLIEHFCAFELLLPAPRTRWRPHR